MEISFSNPLAPKQPVTLQLKPATPGVSARISDGKLYARGSMKGQTDYQLTLPAGLRDIYGQTLTAPQILSFHTPSHKPQLKGPGKKFLVLDPAEPPQLNFTCRVFTRGDVCGTIARLEKPKMS